MLRDELKEIGFSEINHFTVMNSLIYDLGRNRQLSIGCIGTPNETVWLCELDVNNDKKITDLVCLRNYDYDGFTDIETIKNIIKYIKGNK